MDEISSLPVDRLWRPAESPVQSQQEPPRRQQQDRQPPTPAHDDEEEPHELDRRAAGLEMADLISTVESSIHEAIEALSKAAADRFLECVAEQQRLCQMWRVQVNCAPRALGGCDARTREAALSLSQAAQLYRAVIQRAEATNRAVRGAMGISYPSGEF